MQFFSNKIYVSGPQKSFQDIIADVKGNMTKVASKQEPKSAMLHKNTKGKKPVVDEKSKAGAKKPEVGTKKPGTGAGLSAAQKKLPPALQKAILNKKKADSESTLKIASIQKLNKDEVILTLAAYEDGEDREDGEEIIIDDDSECEGKYKKIDKESMSDEESMLAMTGKKSCSASKLSSQEPKFVKIANLTDKQKGNFRKYWGDVWPKEFIDALLSVDN